MNILPSDVRDRLAAQAEAADYVPDWPSAWTELQLSGALAWSIPIEYGGTGLPPVALLKGSEEIASACLTTAFILSQRETAVRRLLAGPEHLKKRYLPGLAAGYQFWTVGLSQLTTSRQHQGPALLATPTGSGKYRLNGEIPWVTGANLALAIVVGATLPDSMQLLFVLPTELPGVTIGPPLSLAALVGSRTSLVRCENVEVDAELILAGPTEKVLGTVGGGGLETSCLALGLAKAATEFLQKEAITRPELANQEARFHSAIDAARKRLHELASLSTPNPDLTLALRVDCTRLALQASQTTLLTAKGAGFISPHPAQRWARQALFFLVWSCPRPVAQGVLDELLPSV